MLGPTASAKSEVALRIARRFGGHVFSVDSMQVYRTMDIGTAKPTAADRAATPHHLIDLVDPEVDFTVADFQRAAHRELDTLPDAALPVIVGGSGLHFRAIVDPLTFAPTDADVRRDVEATDHEQLVIELVAADPGADAHVDLGNPRRVIRAVEILRITGATPSQRAATPEAEALRRYESRIPVIAIGLDPGDALAERTERRFDRMLAQGLLDEVAGLAGRMGRTARQAVGYKQLLPVVAGDRRLDEARNEAIGATLALAKRQRTFFRRDPRIVWLPWHDDAEVRVEHAIASVERELACTS